jgi:hypothetical protein
MKAPSIGPMMAARAQTPDSQPCTRARSDPP